MRRKALGRDLGLTIRMVEVLALVALFYLVAIAISLLVLVLAIVDRAGWVLLFWLFANGVLVLAIRSHLAKVEKHALRAARAKLLEPGEKPELDALVARVAAAADLPPPRIALIRSWAPNAFAIGLSPKRAVIAVTTELLRRLDTQELEAVVAHELAHIGNRDGMVMTIANGPCLFGTAMRNESTGRGWFFFYVYYWPIYLISLVFVWTLSRYREYVADRGSALITGAPEQLMSALTKIGGAEPRGDLRGGAAVSALCIVPAQRRKRRLDFLRRLEIFMDHPPLEKRLRALEKLARDVGRPAA